MNTEEPKCGDNCKLVEMLATKTSKEQAMENAIAAVQTGNISVRGAANQFGVSRTTLVRKLKGTGPVAQTDQGTTQPESPPDRTKVADKVEREQWWADFNAGLSIRKISDKYGRDRKPITKEIRLREKAESQSDSAPTPTPVPTPAPSVPSAGHSTSKEEIQVTPTGQLNEHMKTLVKRECKSGKERLKIAAALVELQGPIEKTMKAASRDFARGPGIVRCNVQAAERQLAKDGKPSIKETLEEVRKQAQLVWKYADESLRLLQLQQGFSDISGS